MLHRVVRVAAMVSLMLALSYVAFPQEAQDQDAQSAGQDEVAAEAATPETQPDDGDASEALQAEEQDDVDESTTEASSGDTEVLLKYGLAAFIALFTGIGVAMLIYYAFRPLGQALPHQDRQRAALHMIAIALIVEAVLICSVLGISAEHYEALYAAIAGYVLGTLDPKGSVRSGKGKGGDDDDGD